MSASFESRDMMLRAARRDVEKLQEDEALLDAAIEHAGRDRVRDLLRGLVQNDQVSNDQAQTVPARSDQAQNDPARSAPPPTLRKVNPPVQKRFEDGTPYTEQIIEAYESAAKPARFAKPKPKARRKRA